MTMSKQIIEVLEYLCTKLGITMDWSSENILPYAQELAEKIVKWRIANAWIWIVLGIIFVICSMVLFYCEAHYEVGGGFFMLGCVCLSIGGVLIFVNIYDIVKGINFPDLVVYEYLKSLTSTR